LATITIALKAWGKPGNPNWEKLRVKIRSMHREVALPCSDHWQWRVEDNLPSFPRSTHRPEDNLLSAVCSSLLKTLSLSVGRPPPYLRTHHAVVTITLLTFSDSVGTDWPGAVSHS